MRIAGGILVSVWAWASLKPKDNEHTDAERAEAVAKEIYHLRRLLCHSLSGFGAISVVIGIALCKGALMDYVYIALGILVVAIVYLTLRSSNRLVKLLT